MGKFVQNQLPMYNNVGCAKLNPKDFAYDHEAPLPKMKEAESVLEIFNNKFRSELNNCVDNIYTLEEIFRKLTGEGVPNQGNRIASDGPSGHLTKMHETLEDLTSFNSHLAAILKQLRTIV